MMSFFLIVFFAYALLTAVLFALQRRLIYHPGKIIEKPEGYGLSGFQDTMVKTSDGLSIQLWFKPAIAGFPTILYCHGNAAHIGNRAHLLGALAEKGFGVLGVSYRGYGKSEGRPTEKGLYIDARTALDFLTNTQAIPLGRILLFGESLGTGVAVHLAAEHAVGGLILQAPYTSVAKRAAELYFYVPVRILIRDRYDSLSKIPRVKAPLLVFHGEQDRVIPIQQGRTLYAAALSPKKAFFFPEFSHNDFDSSVISAHVLDFAKEHRLITS